MEKLTSLSEKSVVGLLEGLSRRRTKKFTPFYSVVLNAPFCLVKQKLRKKQSEVSMVKIPQHKVTKFNKFFRGSSSYYLSNPTENLQRLTIPNPLRLILILLLQPTNSPQQIRIPLPFFRFIFCYFHLFSGQYLNGIFLPFFRRDSISTDNNSS